MANIVKYYSKPVLKDPYFIESLPGVGNVGKIAGDFLADSVEAIKFASIYSEDFPPQVTLDEDSVINLACNELWYASVNGKDVIFLKGEYQGSTPEGQFYLAQQVMNILKEMGVVKIITLGGYGTGTIIEEPRILGAVSDKKLKEEFEGYGVTFLPNEPQAGIVGAAGLLIGLGKVFNIDSICLMGETSGFFVDHKSAKVLVDILMKVFSIELNTDELREKTEQLNELTAKIKAVGSKRNDDLNYIG